MDKSDLESRTRALAIAVIGFVESIPCSRAASVVARQLVRSGTSVGANCKEASRAESRRDFIHKIALAEKECAETQYWLDLCGSTRMGDRKRLAELKREVAEVLAILVSIGRSAKSAPAPPRR